MTQVALQVQRGDRRARRIVRAGQPLDGRDPGVGRPTYSTSNVRHSSWKASAWTYRFDASLELVERVHQRVGDEAAAEGAEVAGNLGEIASGHEVRVIARAPVAGPAGARKHGAARAFHADSFADVPEHPLLPAHDFRDARQARLFLEAP